MAWLCSTFLLLVLVYCGCAFLEAGPPFTFSVHDVDMLLKLARFYKGKPISFEKGDVNELLQRHKQYACLPIKEITSVHKYEGDGTFEDMKMFIDVHTGFGGDTHYLEYLELTKKNMEATGSVCEEKRLDDVDLLEYMLEKRKPVVLKQAAKYLKDLDIWNLDQLRAASGEKKVWVKVSDSKIFEGIEKASKWQNNDEAVANIPKEVKDSLGETIDLVVVRPYHFSLRFDEFVDLLRQPNETCKASYYLEYFPSKDVFPQFEKPDFISALPLVERHQNIWLGDGNTVGKLHFDEYENLMMSLRGTKEFILFDERSNLYERHLREGKLCFDPSQCRFERRSLPEQTAMVMSPVDLDDIDTKRFPQFNSSRATVCKVDEGDVLYVPSFFWHEVVSSPSESERMNLAINWWFEPLWKKEFPCDTCEIQPNRIVYEKLFKQRFEKSQLKE